MSEKQESENGDDPNSVEAKSAYFTEYDSKPALVLVASIGNQDYNVWLSIDVDPLNDQGASNLAVVGELSQIRQTLEKLVETQRQMNSHLQDVASELKTLKQ